MPTCKAAGRNFPQMLIDPSRWKILPFLQKANCQAQTVACGSQKEANLSAVLNSRSLQIETHSLLVFLLHAGSNDLLLE